VDVQKRGRETNSSALLALQQLRLGKSPRPLGIYCVERCPVQATAEYRMNSTGLANGFVEIKAARIVDSQQPHVRFWPSTSAHCNAAIFSELEVERTRRTDRENGAHDPKPSW
jgi:hypothetical protein